MTKVNKTYCGNHNTCNLNDYAIYLVLVIYSDTSIKL